MQLGAKVYQELTVSQVWCSAFNPAPPGPGKQTCPNPRIAGEETQRESDLVPDQ